MCGGDSVVRSGRSRLVNTNLGTPRSDPNRHRHTPTWVQLDHGGYAVRSNERLWSGGLGSDEGGLSGVITSWVHKYNRANFGR